MIVSDICFSFQIYKSEGISETVFIFTSFSFFSNAFSHPITLRKNVISYYIYHNCLCNVSNRYKIAHNIRWSFVVTHCNNMIPITFLLCSFYIIQQFICIFRTLSLRQFVHRKGIKIGWLTNFIWGGVATFWAIKQYINIFTVYEVQHVKNYKNNIPSLTISQPTTTKNGNICY